MEKDIWLVQKKIACTDVNSQYSFKDPLICSSSSIKNGLFRWLVNGLKQARFL